MVARLCVRSLGDPGLPAAQQAAAQSDGGGIDSLELLHARAGHGAVAGIEQVMPGQRVFDSMGKEARQKYFWSATLNRDSEPIDDAPNCRRRSMTVCVCTWPAMLRCSVPAAMNCSVDSPLALVFLAGRHLLLKQSLASISPMVGRKLASDALSTSGMLRFLWHASTTSGAIS